MEEKMVDFTILQDLGLQCQTSLRLKDLVKKVSA